MRIILILLPLAISGCHATDPAAKARQDARDVAMVEAAQHVLPPPMPLVPRQLAAADLANGTCRYGDPAHAAGQPILAIGPGTAVMRLAGGAELFAVDAGSAPLSGGAFSRYAGKMHALRLEPHPRSTDPAPTGFTPAPRQPVALVVTDEHERTVFESVGDLTCS